MSAAEDHYVLSPPDLMERWHHGGRRLLPSARWTDLGPGRHAAAATLLRDATGRATHRVAGAFARDVLAPHPMGEPLLLAVREVRAWRTEREPELLRAARARAMRPQTATLPHLLAERDSEFAGGPLASWLAVFRAVHGDPLVDRRTEPTEDPG